jgi:PAS domain S-box-containing protein
MGIKSWIQHAILKSGIIGEALRQAEDRIFKAFHASPTAISISTLEGRYLDVNESLLEILGYSRNEIVGHAYGELGIWVDPGVRARAVEALLQGRPVRALELQLRNRSGQVLDVSVSMELILQRAEPCVLTMTQDITERKRAEAALLASEERYREISELISDFAYSLQLTPQGTLVLDWVTAAFSRITGLPPEDFVTIEDLLMLVHPEDRASARLHFDALISGQTDERELRILTHDGTVRWLRLVGSPAREPDTQGVTRIYGAAEEITSRIRAYQLLESREAERARELTVLLDVAYRVASTLELEPLLSLILSELQKLVDYTGAAIMMSDGPDLVFLDYRGPMPREQVMQLRIPIRETAGYMNVVKRREPMIIPDIWGNTAIAQSFQRSVECLSPAYGYAHSWMGVPLAVKERLIGIIRFDHRDRNYFTTQHAKLAMAIANQAAVAIENARLYERAQKLGILEERQRIARELHDSISQALFGIKLGAQTAIEVLDKDPARLAESLEYVRGLADAGLIEMRALLYELRPEAVATEGLVAGLQKHIASLRARYGIEVHADFCDEPKVSLEVKEAIYRIVQEALNNIATHAQATLVRLGLFREDGMVRLEVNDNGIGFDQSTVAPGHLGLRSMGERAAHLGGLLMVESAPRVGTTIHLQIPVRD